MTDVLDAWALLAYPQGEKGADVVQRVLSDAADTAWGDGDTVEQIR